VKNQSAVNANQGIFCKGTPVLPVLYQISLWTLITNARIALQDVPFVMTHLLVPLVCLGSLRMKLIILVRNALRIVIFV
jgi:hypothetical protein